MLEEKGSVTEKNVFCWRIQWKMWRLLKNRERENLQIETQKYIIQEKNVLFLL